MGHVIGIDTTYTGNPVSFNAVNGGTMKSIVAPLTYSQDLHGYAYPWPAGGGINKADYPAIIAAGATEQSDGSLYVPSATAYSNLVIFQNDGTAGQFTISFKSKNPGTSRGVYPVVKYTDNTTQAMNVTGHTGYATVTLTTNSAKTVDNVFFSYGSNVAAWFYVQVESGATAHDWTPYSNTCPISGLTGLSVYVSLTQDPDDATVYNVNWSTQTGTVYGGTVDVVTGVLTVDSVSFTADGTQSIYASTNNRFYIQKADAKKVDASNQATLASVRCDKLKSVSWTTLSGSNGDVCCAPVYGRGVAFRYDRITTAADWKTYFTNNPTQFVYTLDTPITYQLTPKQITALTGQNYIWSSNNQTLNTVLTAPATGFAGWLIKCVTNGTPVEIPLKYMRAETYTVTPDQRMEWSAERDVTGVLHRETVQNLPPKIEFNTPLMTNSDINALNNIIKAAFTSYLQRNITIQFYDPERNQYWEWDCYMPDVKYHIRNADTVNNIINYEELRYAFIGY